MENSTGNSSYTSPGLIRPFSAERRCAVDAGGEIPYAGDLHVAGMLLHRKPPPGDRHAGDHVPAVAVLLRPLLHADIHKLQVLPFGLEPEVDGALLLGFVFVVEDCVGKPAVAFHAAHDLYVLVDQVEIGIELRIAEHEHAVMRALVDYLLHRRIDVVLGEVPFRGRGGRSDEDTRYRDVCRSKAQSHGNCRGLRTGAPVSHQASPDHWLVVPCAAGAPGAGALADLAVP